MSKNNKSNDCRVLDALGLISAAYFALDCAEYGTNLTNCTISASDARFGAMTALERAANMLREVLGGESEC